MSSSDAAEVKQAAPVPLKPLGNLRQLAGTPESMPRYAVSVKDSDGQDVALGDPAVTRALVALISQHAVDGGAACHWGGPAAFAEIMSAIHGLMFSIEGRPWHQAFNFINDAGHTENGIYALRANLGFDGITFEDIKGFRAINSKFTGHGEAHLNPQGVLVSNGPLGSGLPQAQGLCLADKALGNDRITICTISDGASMEGEAKESFSAIPGLAAKGLLNPFVMVVSDNDTKLSGRISKDSFSMAPSFKAFPALGWNTVYVEKGHDLQKVYSAIEKAIANASANPEKPVCIVVKTIKGYGVKSTEESSSGGHGYPLKKHDGKIAAFVDEIFGGKAPAEFKDWAAELAAAGKGAVSTPKPEPKPIKVQSGIAKGAIRAAEAGYPVFAVSADLAGSTGIAPFCKAYPARAIDAGVAEANMISMGVGLSLAGLIPIVDTFAQFGITKGNLPLIMAGLSNAPVIGLFSHTGFQDAADGASHQATTYLAATGAIPQVTTICCACADEAEAFMYQAVKSIADGRNAGKHPDSVLLFIGREDFPPALPAPVAYEWGKAQVLREGTDVVIAAAGPMTFKAWEAAQLLAAKGIQAAVINSSFINKPDTDTVGKWVEKCGGRLVTVEDHQLTAGFGAQLSHALLLKGTSLKLKSLGIQSRFGRSGYMADELYNLYGLNADAIVKAALELK